MRVNEDRCSGCKLCLDYCPVGAIVMEEREARINEDLCTECGNCKRVDVCAEGAFEETQLEWPRSIRAIFSNPLSEFKETGITGRGTEEMKTNDVTGRFGPDDIGFAVDVGRPNVGTRLKEVEKLTKAVAEVEVLFEPHNPVTFLMKNKQTGELKPEVRNANVVSSVVEFKVGLDKVLEVVRALKKVARNINTVFSVGVITRVGADGSIPVRSLLEPEHIDIRPNGKTNLGLGRILSP